MAKRNPIPTSHNKNLDFWPVAVRFISLLLLAPAVIGCTQQSTENEAMSTATQTSFGATEPPTASAVTRVNSESSPTTTRKSPAVKVVPVPLPTTVPDQAAQLAQAADKKVNSVDFVIDTMELEEGKVPWRFATGTNWYKYTSPEGEFSILMLSSVAPEYATSPNATRYDTSEVHLVSSTFPIPMLMHTVVYYDLSKKTVGDEELTDFLDKYPFTDTASIIRQTEIELDGYRGREFVRRTNSEGETDVQFDMRTRVYVVENTVYEISVSAWDPEEVFGGNGNRFLDSFTLSTSSN